MLLQGPLYAAAALLVVAGGQKVADPVPLVRALRSTGIRVPRLVVRAAAAGEVALGLGALLWGGRAAAVGVGLSYLAFTGFVLLALARGGVLASCGCFGKSDVPPTRAHAVVTAALAAAALSGTPGAVPREPALLAATAALAACAYLVLAVLPLVRAR
jgi:hypothetical protein